MNQRIKEQQQALNKHGFNAGSEDGILGPRTRKAIELCIGWQIWLNNNGFNVGRPDGFPGKLFDAGMKAFQTNAGCEYIDGIIGVESANARAHYRKATPAPIPNPAPQTPLNIIDPHLTFTKPIPEREKTNYIIYHHAAASTCSVQDVHKWHLARGWLGIGYNFFVRKDGTIYKGRGLKGIGAHCDGHNSESVGICAEGDYSKEQMPEVQKQSLIALGRYVRSLYPQVKPVGHKELDSTACPGTNYPLAEIKAAVVA